MPALTPLSPEVPRLARPSSSLEDVPGLGRLGARGEMSGLRFTRVAVSVATTVVVASALAVAAAGSAPPSLSSLSADSGFVAAFAFDTRGQAAAAARSGGGRWGPSYGPEGRPVFALAVAPSAPEIVYVGTRRGVFRSTNGGRSWTSAGLARFFIPGVTSLAVDPRAPTTVYAGLNRRWAGGMSYHQAVYKSTNGGQTWRALDLRGEPVAISPTAVYAAAGGPQKTSRLVRSIDGGRSWQPADSGLPSTYLWALAFDPSTPTTMYAAMGRRGVFESSDGGAHWRAVGISARYGEVTAIAIDPQHPRTVYAATNAGFVVSHDGGRSWRMLNATIRRHGRDPWYMQVSALLVDPRNSRTVYATTRCAGVFKSTDGGRRWSPANAGLGPQCPWAYSLAFDPRAPRTIYAADPTRGVFKSIDGGTHWQVRNEGLGLASVSSLAVDSQSPRTVYASTGALGLFKSGDGGAHWRPLATGLVGVDAIAVDPSDPANILVAGGSTQGRVPPSGNPIARSTDAGRTWTRPAFGARWVGVVAISGQTAYAGTSDGYGVFGSTDGGHSWRALGPPSVIYVQALAIAPGDPAVVYAGVAYGPTRGLYKSTDGGSSWQRLDALNIGVWAVVLDPEDPSTVYVASNDGEGGVFKSADGGTTWQRENAGLRWRVIGKWKRPTMAITALAIDPKHPTTLYAATDSRGVFRSTDSGKSWHSFNAGLTDRIVTAFALDATGRTVYAATEGGGVVSLHTKT